MTAVAEHTQEMGTSAACEALGVPRATVYRRRARDADPGEPKPRPTPARALSPAEQSEVLDVLHSERFVDKSPGEVLATLLDDEKYLCSERTMYRILASEGEVRERRDQLRHPEYKKPELLATGPNEIWSWDITKLKGPVKWTYFYLYVLLDIFSRYVVGWLLARNESTELARRLISDSCEKQRIEMEQLTIHADRGPSMSSKGVAQLLADLGVTKSHSRPHVSNDNPYSEAQFKTLKYRPGFPDRFGSQEHGLDFCRDFFRWYNTEHRHSGISMLTPEQVHYGLADDVLEKRRIVLETAYTMHPERFVRGVPRPRRLPEAVWINPPARTSEDKDCSVEFVTPGSEQLQVDDHAARYEPLIHQVSAPEVLQ